MKKQNILYFMIISMLLTWMFSACRDYTFENIPDPVVPEDLTPGLKLTTDVVLVDATAAPRGFELRAIGGKWTIEPEKQESWLKKLEPTSGDEGNAVIGITLERNDGMEERSVKLIIRQEQTGVIDTVLVRQFTHESKYTRETDSLSLIVLYEELNVENWRNPWNLKQPITGWSGLTFDEVNGEQRVVGITFNDWQMQGELPNEIGNLRELKRIKMSGNSLTGRVPNGLVNLRKLETLDISFSENVSWFLPENMSDLKSLKEFKVGGLNIHLTSFNRLYKVETLEAISITWSTIQGKLPDGISSLTKLKNLNLGGTRITSLPSDITTLSELVVLNIGRCSKLTSLPENIGDLSQLEQLDMNNSGVEILPEGFGRLTGLKSLNISYCGALKTLSQDFGNLRNMTSFNMVSCAALESLPESFGDLIQLTTLSLSRCESLVSLPESIGKLTGLTSLDLSNCKSLQTLPSSISKLSNIKELSMSSCASLSSLPETVADMKWLKKIVLTNTSLTSLPAFFSQMTSLEELDITGPYQGGGMQGDAATLFAGMTGLKKLSADYNSFSGDLAWIKNLPNLEVLKMNKNQLSGNIDFTNFGSKLTEISLAENLLTGTLKGIGNLTAVKKLDLNKNQLSGALPSEMGACTVMTNLNLKDNNLTGTIPIEVTQMMQLTWGGLGLSGNQMSGEIPSEVLSWSKWSSLSPTWNIYPQQEGYGFTNIP